MENQANNTIEYIENEFVEQNTFTRCARHSMDHITMENPTRIHGPESLTSTNEFTSTKFGMLRWASRGMWRARAHYDISFPSSWATIQVRMYEVCSKNCNIIIYLFIHVSS